MVVQRKLPALPNLRTKSGNESRRLSRTPSPNAGDLGWLQVKIKTLKFTLWYQFKILGGSCNRDVSNENICSFCRRP